jgi:prepilin-type N-terminal cleavage/methylation domain-containing protein
MLTRRSTVPRPRRGFTLIEILVVISIIGILTAISAGALFRLRAAQTVNNTEGTLSKLHGLMMTRWSAVADQAKKDVPASLVDRCGGDRERAIAIWTYATLKNEFPMTFAEAKATINFGPGAVLQPRKIFTVAANATYTPALTPLEESATLAYVGITQGGNKGNAAGTDGSNQQTGNTSPDGKGAPVYKDGWGIPIVFFRHATAAGSEINSPPYSRANKVNLGGTSTNVNNMLDPRALISDWGVAGTNPWLGLTTLDPNAMPQNNAAYLRQELSKGLTGVFAPPASPPISMIRAAENTVPTLMSAGANKDFGSSFFIVDDLNPSADNLLSYRLRREGDKGN